MGFTDVTFLFLFLPVSIILYLAAEKLFHNDKINNLLIVVLSAAFYFWGNARTFYFIVAAGLFIFLAGQSISKAKRKKKKRRLVFTVICLAGILLFYKYVALLCSLLNQIANQDLITVGDILIPVGISYIVFEAISYIADIRRKDAEAGTLLECFTFLSLFPKLVSGPIVLWKDFRSQLKNRRSDIDRITAGLDRIIIGYAKKVILADTFGSQIALINSAIAAGGVDVPTMWLRALLYFFQLYFDFSGYSDIAIGLCGIFGFKIKENFRFPYLSKSLAEFWRRWHISLGIWFREYVYIPLGGNRRGNVYIHLLIVFVLTGLWHGTGWQFLIWGGVHGIFIIIERAIRKTGWYQRIPGAVKWLLTMGIVYFAWVLFMSKDLPDAFQSYACMFSPMTTETVNFTWQYFLSGRTILFLAIAVAGQILGIEIIRRRIMPIVETPAGDAVKRVLLLLLFAMDILYVVNSTYSPFIYFQF